MNCANREMLRMKRLFAFLIACVLLIGMLPLGVMAAGETVYRVFGANRYATSTLIADKLKEDAGVDRFGSVIVASGANFPDALAGSYLAAVTGAPIILVNKGTVDMDWFSANVAAGANVYILGGEAAVSGKAENQLQGYAVERLAGSNRYETNLIILRKAMELGGSTRDILVCTGGNFADSLSASATGKAILLVNKSLNEEQKAFLASAGCENIYVLGGTAAVSEKIQSSLTSYGPVTRISGNTRYETSVKIAETFFPGATNAVVAYAKNFPDGLCGGPLAICMGSPLILTNTGSEAMAAAYANQAGIHAGIVLGGEGLISDSVAKNVFSADEIVTYQNDSTQVCIHDFADATHTAPKTCKLCGATEGESLKDGISEEEAYEIACDYWNYYDGKVAEETGFTLFIIYDGLLEKSGGNYHAFRLRWWIPENNLASTIDYLYINAETGECSYSI